MLFQRKVPQNIQNTWLEVEGYRFSKVQQFKYLDVKLPQQNDVYN